MANRQPAIYVQNLAEMQRGLRAVDRQWPRELRKLHKEIGDVAAGWSRDRAARGESRIGPIPSSRARESIRGAGEQRSAKVAFGYARVPWAVGMIMGAKKYKQFPTWVGNTWDAGVAGQGPYYINPAVADHKEEIQEMLMERIVELTDRVPGFSPSL